MIGLLVALIVLAIVLWGVNQIPLPEPFSWVKILIFCVAAIWFVLYAAKTLGVAVPGLN